MTSEKLDFKMDNENDALLLLNDMQFHQDQTIAMSARLMKHMLPASLQAVDAELDRSHKDETQFRVDLMMATTLACVNMTINMLINIMPPPLLVDHIDGIADNFAAMIKTHGAKLREQYGVNPFEAIMQRGRESSNETNSKELIERLREAHKRGEWNDWDADLFEEAADDLEEMAKKTFDLREQLSRSRQRKEDARRDIKRAMDKYLKDEQS